MSVKPGIPVRESSFLIRKSKQEKKIVFPSAKIAIEEAEVVSLDDERWSIEARESERVSYLGQDALRLLGGTNDAVVKHKAESLFFK